MMGDVSRQREFDNVFMTLKMGQYAQGKIKFAEAGIGFKEAKTGTVTTLPAADIKRMQWTRVSRNYQLKISKKDRTHLKIDGFPKNAYDGLSSLVKSYYQIALETQEMSLRGWNWGRTDFQSSSLAFLVGNRPAFDIPLDEIANVALPSKNEVAVEFVTPNTTEYGRKVKDDTLVELRFFVPGTATLAQVGESGVETGRKVGENVDQDVEGEEEEKEEGEIDMSLEEPAIGEDGNVISAAALLFDTIKQRADVGTVVGEAIVGFKGVLCLTPRGRFEIELHTEFFRLRGKSHDYKVNYSSIIKLFSLPKPDDMHQMFVIGLDPPLRQGQTRYPFLVFQFEREEEIELELNIEEEILKTKYEGKLQKSYDAPSFEVIGDLFKGISGRKLIESGSYKTAQGFASIRCFYKANEAFLYPLEKSFLSIPKPPIFIPHSQISRVTFSRVGGASSTTKSFEVKFNMDNGQEYSYSSIPREEYQSLESFCKMKNLRISNDLADEAMNYGLGGESEEEIVGERGSKRVFDEFEDEEESSEDEDFIAGDEGSDVDEEYNSEFESSGDDEGGNDGDEKDNASGIEKGSQEEREKSSSKKQKKPKSSSPKKRAKKDKNAPKRALSAYMFFMQDKRPEVVAANPGSSITDHAKILGQMWKELNAEDKVKYEEMASKDKERYAEQMEAYQSSGTASRAASPAPAQKSSGSNKNIESAYKSEEFVESDEE